MAASFWLEEPAPAPRRAAGDGAVDVAIVGSGVTGCSAALTLAQAGLRVRVYDARGIAAGASGRNGGFALRGGAMAYDVACRDLGRDRARTLWELTERALERMRSLAGDAFRHTGSLRLAADAHERAALEAEYEALCADGFAAEWAPLAAAVAALFPAGLWHPPDGAIQPARWVRRLAGHAEAAGAEFTSRRVVELDELPAEQVLVATDGFTPDLLPELPIRPVRGQVLVTEPLDEQLFPFPHYARDGYDYWQQLPDGRLVIGGCRDVALDDEFTAEEATSDVVQAKIEALVERLVGRRPAVTHRWAGIWGQTEDRLPLVGRVPAREHLWVAAGYSGHGNVLGLACGELVAGAIVGDAPPELALFDPAKRDGDALPTA